VGRIPVLGAAFRPPWKGLGTELQAALEIDGRHYDEMRLVFPDGTTKTVYFDLSAIWGKL